ncbi:hypothetical protein Kuja_0810 [Vibrio phage vB_VchM_Kuja]|uniref:Uncharacterized protein n=1 Tax=Vibrio phage vB_VchM_Kuja TaxID=2686437 RepID=A0A6B9JBW9_9CAUD|nr:hypothetical protein HWC83_gp155 [Vibrio phage vB_VchM_Kuja]QGZ16072.1 hypothetical protein Kuja_0810 [Vibrio phage vB_VchM_Kuja]
MKLSKTTLSNTLIWIYLNQNTKFQRKEVLQALENHFICLPDGKIALTKSGLLMLSTANSPIWDTYTFLEKHGYFIDVTPTNRDTIVFRHSTLPLDDSLSLVVFQNLTSLYDKNNKLINKYVILKRLKNANQ